MFYVWLTIVVLLTIVEAMTVNLTTIWFVVSGLVAIGLSFVTDIFLIQFGVFVCLGIVLLIVTKPFVKKFLDSRDAKTNFDRIIGMTGIVLKEINDVDNGEVKVDGKIWTAYSDDSLKVNDKVKVLEISGSKIKVRKVGK